MKVNDTIEYLRLKENNSLKEEEVTEKGVELMKLFEFCYLNINLYSHFSLNFEIIEKGSDIFSSNPSKNFIN